mmetsp:Transcript_17240/g.48020  ORF Transcript_17240/g.48020 Transcript_17240/m.48020 type:complete len:388 (-) Transcript_17240:151-1314(-)
MLVAPPSSRDIRRFGGGSVHGVAETAGSLDLSTDLIPPRDTIFAQLNVQFHHNVACSRLVRWSMRRHMWRALGVGRPNNHSGILPLLAKCKHWHKGDLNKSNVRLGLDSGLHTPPYLFTLVLNAQASNGRRMQREIELTERLRQLVDNMNNAQREASRNATRGQAAAGPAGGGGSIAQTSHADLEFRAVDLQSLSLVEELRLLSRTRVLVALFGSALHNCRLLAPPALVVEIHGALISDHGESDVWLYARLCTEMGHRWVGVPVPNALPTKLLGKHPNGAPIWGHHNQSNDKVADIDIDAVVEVVERALATIRGVGHGRQTSPEDDPQGQLTQWRAMHEEYGRKAYLDHRAPNPTATGNFARTVDRLMTRPQYARRGWSGKNLLELM